MVEMSAGLRLVGVYCGTRVPASTYSSVQLYSRSPCFVRVPFSVRPFYKDDCCSVVLCDAVLFLEGSQRSPSI